MPNIATVLATDRARIGEEFRDLDGGTDPFATAVRATRLPMVVSDPRHADNPIVFANDSFCGLTGYDRSEIIGRNCRFLQGPETDRATAARIRAAIGSREPIEADILNYRKDGTPFWNRLLIAPVRDSSGEVTYFLASQADITPEHALLEELRASNMALLAETACRAPELAGSEARLALVVEAGRLGVFEHDLAAEEPADLPGLRQLLGRLADDPSALAQVRAAVHPDDWPRLLERLDRSLAGEAEFDLEYRIVRDQRPAAWLHVRALILRDPAGRPTRMVGTGADITDRRIVVEQLLAGERRLRVALDAGELGSWELDLASDRTICSDRHHAIFGYATPPAAWGRATFTRHVVAEDRPAVDAAFAAAEHGEPLNLRARIVRAGDGAIRWIEARGVSLPDADGILRRITGVVADVTAEVEAAAAQKQLNELLEARIAERTRERDRMWQASRDLLIALDTTGVILSVNPAWTRLLGWREDELLGRTFADFVYPDDVAASLGALRTASADTRPQLATRSLHRDGSIRWIDWTASPANGHVTAIGRDVTAERAAAERLHAIEESLRQSQKMEAVGQLTGGIAHDFNNLLTGMLGALELIETRIAQGRTGELTRYVDAARQSAERASSLTHRLLAFSRQKALDPQPIRCGAVLAGMEEMIRTTIGPRIVFGVLVPADTWATLCDENQFENALLNLCINARDAMPDGGRLTIEAVNRRIETATEDAPGLPAGDYVRLSVSDTGAGMPPEVIARAFDPFFTTKPVGQGTGLGLSMTYGFARQSGGQLHIFSRVGEGATIVLHLPRHDAAIPSAIEPAAHQIGREGFRPPARGTVLVVEDEAAIRDLIVEVLQERGATILHAGDAAAALTLLRAGVAFDLLLTDVGLPGEVNGRELAALVRRERPATRVLFITGYADPADLPRDPATSILIKPFAMATLADRVEAMLVAGA